MKAPPTPANEITHATTPATRGPSGLRERFEAALRCDPDTRAAWLDTHCTNAVERNTIERMLARYQDILATVVARPAIGVRELADRSWLGRHA